MLFRRPLVFWRVVWCKDVAGMAKSLPPNMVMINVIENVTRLVH